MPSPPTHRDILIADAASLRHLAIAGALARLLEAPETIIIVDIVALELVADLEAPGARAAHQWIVAGTAPGSSARIEIAVTETGTLLRLARQVDPRVASKNMCRRAIIDFVGERIENAAAPVFVICDDEIVARAITKNGAVVKGAHELA